MAQPSIASGKHEVTVADRTIRGVVNAIYVIVSQPKGFLGEIERRDVQIDIPIRTHAYE